MKRILQFAIVVCLLMSSVSYAESERTLTDDSNNYIVSMNHYLEDLKPMMRNGTELDKELIRSSLYVIYHLRSLAFWSADLSFLKKDFPEGSIKRKLINDRFNMIASFMEELCIPSMRVSLTYMQGTGSTVIINEAKKETLNYIEKIKNEAQKN